MKTLLVVLSALFMNLSNQTFGQGIVFFEGDYQAALTKAKQEKKLLFVDFYADWCGPCKQMAKNVFTQKVIGDYFNDKFVSIQVDAEDVANRAIVKQYRVKSYPTLAFFNGDGKMLLQNVGALDVEALLKSGKIATGEAMSFEEVYNKFKSSKGDLRLMQQVLIDAPSFVSTLESNTEREKWIVRVEKIFEDYIAKKMGPALINAEDYRIITTFHQPEKAGDKLVEFINENMVEFLKLGEGPAYYVLEYNDKIIEGLARAGKKEYTKYLDRIDGDMKLAYSVVPQKTLTARQRYAYVYDAEYKLFYEKDGESYVELMDTYFNALGEELQAADYGMAAQKIYQATGGKVSDNVKRKALEWTIKALQFKNVSLMDKINYLAMLGDTHRELKEYDESKKCYNQAFMESMQLGQEMTKAMIQMKIKQKLATLDLLKK